MMATSSVGPPDTGYFAQGPGTLARMALEMGVKEVGLSSIYQVLLYHIFQFYVTVRQIAGRDLWSIQEWLSLDRPLWLHHYIFCV